MRDLDGFITGPSSSILYIIAGYKRKMNSQLLGSSSAQVLLGMHYITRGAAADQFVRWEEKKKMQ